MNDNSVQFNHPNTVILPGANKNRFVKKKIPDTLTPNPPSKSKMERIKVIVDDYLGDHKKFIKKRTADKPSNKPQPDMNNIAEIVDDYLTSFYPKPKPVEEPKQKFQFSTLNKQKEPEIIITPVIEPPKYVEPPPVVKPKAPVISNALRSKYVDGDDKEILDRVIEDLSDYLAYLVRQNEGSNEDAIKLIEIEKLLEIIQYHMRKRQGLPQKDPNKSVLTNQTLPNRSLESTMIPHDDTVHGMLNDMLDHDDYGGNLNSTLLKRKATIEEKLKKKDNRVAKNISNIFINQDRSPAKPYISQIQNPLTYPLLSKNKSELFSNPNLAAERYGIKLEVPVMQEFLKTRKMTPNILNFLIFFLQEKADHQRLYNDGFKYGTSIKLFPLQFYLALTNQLISNTYRIEYMDASRFTFENTGQDHTIFNIYDWIVVPIMELPSEYSLVVGNLSSRTLYCFQLSSLGLRVSDPMYMNPDKNPYLKNVQAFLHREFEIKCSRSRIELGNYTMVFGRINKDPNYVHKMRYEDSGLHAIWIIIHLLKQGNLNEISIDEKEMHIFCKSLHDLIIRIGYNMDENITYIFNENKWPF